MIVSLMGGLANQMFQYAFGISVASARNEEVVFTDHLTKGDHWRPMAHGALARLVTDIKIVGEENERQPFFMDNIHFNFQPEVYTIAPGTTFLGYWQTEKYFNRDLVLQKMFWRYPLSDQSQRVANAIEQAGKSSVFLHVRRGADYKRSDHHGVLTMKYFNEATRRIRAQVSDVKFFVFGDDHDFMRQNFFGPEFVLVNHIPPDTSLLHEDMQLMSFCKHGVISNSSFSWWAAWLGDQSDRFIFAPKRWFGSQTPVETCDIVPDRWTRLEV
jgi:hypothetical protein